MREPCNPELAPGQDDESRQQRTDGGAGVAAYLKEGLREPMLSARGDARNAGGFGMEDRRADAHHCGGHQQQAEGGRNRQQSQFPARVKHIPTASA